MEKNEFYAGLNMMVRSPLSWFRSWRTLGVWLLAALCSLAVLWPTPAFASLENDTYDGDIFALYAGNGSLVPPKFSLAEALKRDRPTLLVLYVDDSSDCKRYATTVSQWQSFYGRAADFLPIRVDAIPVKDRYQPNEPGYYYEGVVPQTVLFDAAGKVALNAPGNLTFEQVDDKFRDVFNLLPRSESEELKRRPVNEVNTELVTE